MYILKDPVTLTFGLFAIVNCISISGKLQACFNDFDRTSPENFKNKSAGLTIKKCVKI